MELSLRAPIRSEFFAKRDEIEKALHEAVSQLEAFKKRAPEDVYPKAFYGKKSLEMMDMVLEGLMHERIKILEDLLK